MTIVNPTALSVINLVFWVLLLAAFVVEIWAFGDALTRPKSAFLAVGKLSKPLWLVILGVAFLIGLGGAIGFLQLLSFFPIIAFVAAAVYLADIRVKVRGLPRSASRSGPYGPW